MTYFGFLLRFLVLPILILGALAYRDARRNARLPDGLQSLPLPLVVGILALIAVVYTTPWDNYLVATGVWWYNPALVTGITLGWVPLEEYTFFVLQTIMAGLWLLLLARRISAATPFMPRKKLCALSAAAVGVVWIASMILLLSGWKPGNYLSLELVWALPPIAIQLAVGADILWHYRRLVIVVLSSATLYLCAADSLAIHSGTWTINPELTLGVKLGVLPIEEAVFFFLTNTLLVFGLVLGLAYESRFRLRTSIRGLQMRQNDPSAL